MHLESTIGSTGRVIPVFGLALAGALMVLAFLLPNHAPPWMSFWQECLMAMAVLLVVFALLGERRRVAWQWPELMVLGLLALPPIQFLSGRILFLQTAWMHSLYLLGLLVAMLAGAALARREPSQLLWLLLGPVWLASIVSVALQLYQWLALPPGAGTLWVYRAVGGRPSANLGQANALASVIVLGLLATYGMWWRDLLRPGAALAAAAYLLMGLVLTQSRTGLLNALIVAASLLLWHRSRPVPGLTRAMFALVILLCVAFVGYSAFSAQIGLPLDPAVAAGRASVGPRPLAWRIFAESVLQYPLFGHGWGQSFLAQMNGALDHPPLHRVFLSAHNLPLELAVWTGLPIALLVVVGLAVWLRACAMRIADERTLLLLLFVVVLLVHALFEYPLAYAYFLLPAGLAAGALSQRVGFKTIWHSPQWVIAGLVVVAAGALAVTVRDYLRVEQSYRDLLFEKARIQSEVQGEPPEVLVLTSLRELIVFSRRVPGSGMSETELSWMTDVVSTHPGAAGFAKVALALVMNGKAVEAQKWVDTLCSVFTEAQCAALAAEWSTTAEKHPEMRVVVWP
jgi:hypothetical protein